MITVQRTIQVARDTDAVFAHVSDPSTYPSFFVGLHGWDPIDGDGRSVGDRLRILLEIGATHAGGIVRVTEVEPGRRFAWQSEVGTRHEAAFDVAPSGAGTQVRFGISFRLAGGTTGRVVELVTAPIVRRIVDATLEALRHHVEWGDVERRVADHDRKPSKESL